MSALLEVLLLITPVVLAGISNMLYMDLPVHEKLRVPMDGGRRWRDGGRLFGDNKTWKGFFGMIVFTALWLGLFEAMADASDPIGAVAPFPFEEWRFPWNGWVFGAWWGLGYVLFELPNSFVKRRVGIAPGENASGLRGLLFTTLDQADSVAGCTLFLLAFYNPGWKMALGILVVGTAIHYLTNVGLYLADLKKQAA